MVFIVVCLFNSIRTTLLIWLIMPLAIIGVTTGLLLTGMPFGFMALFGVLALGGELIKNQIVVLSKILTEIDKGKAPYQAILDGGVSKMRPVCMVVLTTVLGIDPAVDGPVLRRDGGVHHVRAVVRRGPVLDRHAGAVRHLLWRPRNSASWPRFIARRGMTATRSLTRHDRSSRQPSQEPAPAPSRVHLGSATYELAK